MLKLKDPSLLRQQAYIAGEWVDADDGKTVAVTNPATGEQLGTVPMCGTAETARAIAAADLAQRSWRDVPAKERAAILRKLNDLMLANADDLALIMTSEQGKPLAEAKGEIAYAASFIEWFADEARRIYGDTIPATSGDRRIIAIKQPVGVSAAITPWNFPTAMITRKAGPALAAGCTMVVKPATQTPFSALALAELAERAGVPKGVLSVLTGSASADRRRDDALAHRAQAHLHRLDRSRPHADAPERRHDQEALARTRRQRALHRLRRRRPRRGGRRRDDLEVPQHRPDLRLRQPHLCAARRAAGLHRQAGREGQGVEGRQRPRGRRHARPADRCEGGREDRGAHRRRARQGRRGADRRQAPRARRPVLRADGAGRRDRRDAGRAARKPSARWRRSSPSTPRPKSSRSPTTASSAWPRISTAATSAA